MSGLDISAAPDLQAASKAVFLERLFAIILMGYEARLHSTDPTHIGGTGLADWARSSDRASMLHGCATPAARLDLPTTLLTEPPHKPRRANVHSPLLHRSIRKGGSMRRANVQRQSDRRLEILDAAQRCFARSGFHGASMQEICAEARDEPGQSLSLFPLQGSADRRHLRAQPRGGGRQLPGGRPRARVLRGPGGAGAPSPGRADRGGGEPLRRDHGGGRRNPEIARLPAELEPTSRAASSRCCAAPPSAARSRRGRSRWRRHHADGAGRWHVVAPGLDPSFQAGPSLPHVLHIVRYLLMRPPAEQHAQKKEADNESQPHHRARPGRGRHALDRVRASAAARQRRKQRRHSHQRGGRPRSCSGSASAKPASCPTAASLFSPAAPRPTARSPSRHAPAAS